MTVFNIRPEGAKNAYTAYGGCREFLESKDNVVILYGSAGSGKTLACCYKMATLCILYPGVKFLFTRASYTSLLKSGVVTFEHVLRQMGFEVSSKSGPNKVKRFGEREPKEYQFPYAKRMAEDGYGNPKLYEGTSQIILSSLSNAKEELGAEYDYVYLNQPEQSTEEDLQFLITRANGRRGVAPFTQVFGDPNPEHERHWLKLGGYELIDGKMVGEGDRWRLIKSTYKDNPIIWNQKLGCFTPDGEKQIGILKKSLNSVMAARLIEGEWCSFEGLVFGDSWNRNKHFRSRNEYIDKIDETWERYWAIDFGFEDPFVCMFFAKNPHKEEYVCYKYIYESHKTIYEHIDTIKNLMKGEPRPKLIVADRNPENISILIQELGINVISAKKPAGSIKAGISVLVDMLRNDELVILQDSWANNDEKLISSKHPIGFEQEVENYRWNPNRPDEPIGGQDHAVDACRYLMTHIKANQRTVPFIWI